MWTTGIISTGSRAPSCIAHSAERRFVCRAGPAGIRCCTMRCRSGGISTARASTTASRRTGAFLLHAMLAGPAEGLAAQAPDYAHEA